MSEILERLELTGLRLGSPQVYGSLRLIPLLRDTIRDDLRLAAERYAEGRTVVQLGGRPQRPQGHYVGYVPHGLIVHWGDEGHPAAAFGARLFGPETPSTEDRWAVRVATRMVKREGSRRLRLQPLHLALEGFMGLRFGGPNVAWREYSEQALRVGVRTHTETVYSGAGIPGLEDALRTFEVCAGQCGVLLFVADALATAFVVPHPHDYRALHPTLLEDFYGELIWIYGNRYDQVGRVDGVWEDLEVRQFDDLREGLRRLRASWRETQQSLLDNTFGRALDRERVYRLGAFTLERFVTDLVPSRVNHIGERIVREDGTLEYLKTFRLSGSQTRRAYLLKHLAAHQWDVLSTATALGTTFEDLLARLEKAGFGYWLRAGVLEEARRRRARGESRSHDPPRPLS